MVALDEQLFEQIQKLDDEQKKQVLAFVERLTHQEGEPLSEVIQHVEQLAFSHEDLEAMKQYIEEEFERIDWNDWNNPPAFST